MVLIVQIVSDTGVLTLFTVDQLVLEIGLKDAFLIGIESTFIPRTDKTVWTLFWSFVVLCRVENFEV